ncbi:MAG: DUF4332 domain-containing protein, partial [Pirellulales bacterium]
PPDGLDQVSKDILAPLIGFAAVGFARVFERAIDEAQATPPLVAIELQSVLNSLTVPIYAVTRKIRDVKERIQVEAMYREYERTGKVIFTLPEDDKAIRRAHAEEVLNKSLAELDAERIKPPGKLHGSGAPARQTSRKALTRPVVSYAPPLAASPLTPIRPLAARLEQDRAAKPAPARLKARASREHATSAPSRPVDRPRESPRVLPVVSSEPEPDFMEEPAAEIERTGGRPDRFYLDRQMPLDKAPSIGNKTASRFQRIGVRTVGEFLELDPETAARKLNVRHITAQTMREWQAQARLACRIPNIRGHDAQLLVACGLEEPDDVSRCDPQRLLGKVLAFCATSEGQRILRSGALPDLKEVRGWIDAAGQARALRAA